MTDLIKIEEYEEIEKKIDEVRDAANFIPDVSTDDGYEKSKRVSLDIGKLLTALEKKRKDKKKYFLDGGKAVDSQAKSIAAKLEEIQLPHKGAYKELDNLKKEREKARKEELENRVAYIRELPESLRDSHSSEIKAAYESLQDEQCLDFYEFTDQALKARNNSVNELSELFKKTLKAEEDAAELKRLQEEAAIREQKEREERIAKEASEKAEREKAEAIAQAEKEKQLSAEREEKAKQDAENAKRLQAEAEANAKAQAEKAAEDARLAEVERQRLQAEAEAEEERKREANKKHVGAIRKAAKESLMAIGLDEASAKKVVLAINAGEIANVSISY